MDTSKFANNRDQFPILNFIAAFDTKTSTSILFRLGRYGSTLSIPEREGPMYVGTNGVFNILGWADIHHPCHGHIKARIRVLLPSELMEFEIQRVIIDSLLDALSIPRDETYEADFITSIDQASIHQPVDRDGLSEST